MIERTYATGRVEIVYAAHRRDQGERALLCVGFCDLPVRTYDLMPLLVRLPGHAVEVLDGPSPFIDALGGSPGCFYLGRARRLDVHDATLALIEGLRTEWSIDKENVVLLGSGKGGFAALHTAFSGGYGHVVARDPFLRLGQALFGGPLSALGHHLAGGRSEEDAAYLDGVLETSMREATAKPRAHVLAERGTPHFEAHVKPLIDLFGELGIEAVLETAPDVGFDEFAVAVVQRLNPQAPPMREEVAPADTAVRQAVDAVDRAQRARELQQEAEAESGRLAKELTAARRQIEMLEMKLARQAERLDDETRAAAEAAAARQTLEDEAASVEEAAHRLREQRGELAVQVAGLTEEATQARAERDNAVQAFERIARDLGERELQLRQVATAAAEIETRLRERISDLHSALDERTPGVDIEELEQLREENELLRRDLTDARERLTKATALAESRGKRLRELQATPLHRARRLVWRVKARLRRR